LIDATEVGVYHCVQRAARRVWPCGQDPVTGKNFDHRKVWIKSRLAFLAGQFTIDICSMAIMSNHIHLLVRNRPDIAGQWSDEDVARRWWNLFLGRKTQDDRPAEPEPHVLWCAASLAVRDLLLPRPDLHSSLLAAPFQLTLSVQAGLDLDRCSATTRQTGSHLPS